MFHDDPVTDALRNMKNSLHKTLESRQPDIIAFQKFNVPRPDGKTEERYVHLKNSPVLNAEGEITCIVLTFEDATAFMQLEIRGKEVARTVEEKSLVIEENQGRINDLLSALLRYTTMDFSQRIGISDKGDELDAIIVGLNSLIDELESRMDRLNLLNKELEYANNELDSFSYSVSHDLRAPLRAIHGYSQVLMEDFNELLGEDGQRTIEVITRNASRMSDLIDDLLTFSRVGKQNLTKVTLDMNNIVRNVVLEMMDPEKEKRCELTVGALENSEGDGSMIKQVVTNLLSNALKYSGKREKSVIEIGCYPRENMMVYFIKDNGAGFDMKYYEKLFGVFQRLHSGSEFEGTGVGLALVQRIIRKHKGEVWAEAKLDEGATFYFSLPQKTN